MVFLIACLIILSVGEYTWWSPSPLQVEVFFKEFPFSWSLCHKDRFLKEFSLSFAYARRAYPTRQWVVGLVRRQSMSTRRWVMRTLPRGPNQLPDPSLFRLGPQGTQLPWCATGRQSESLDLQ